MKPQDIVFIIVLVFLLYKRNPAYLIIVGLGCLILAMPLFYFQIFFTAQRLMMYAAGFFLIGIITYLKRDL